jgi:hypothetical protein
MIQIIAIRVVDRIKEAGHTQKVLSRYSKLIRARLGFHELNDDICSREGYIVLVVDEENIDYKRFAADLDKIYGIELKRVSASSETEVDSLIPDGDGVVTIVTLMVENRDRVVSEVQDSLSRYGCSIRTRLGLNETINGTTMGVIILELTGNPVEQRGLLNRLSGIEEVTVAAVAFS